MGRRILSDRENEVYCLISQGFSTKEISDRLFISEETAKTHRKNIFKKLGVRNAVEATLMRISKITGITREKLIANNIMLRKNVN